MTDDVHTVYLGQYTHAHADAIAGKLESQNIVWWYKQPGFLSQIWERGVRLFVDREHLDEARAIAERVLAGYSEGEGPAEDEGPPGEEDPPDGEGSSSGQM